MTVTIYHNPACGTSRNTLALIQERGITPHVVEYLKTPLTRDELKNLLEKMDVSVRDVLRQRGTPYDELGLGDNTLSENALIEAMIQHPILLNRPIVVTDKGAKLCRPAETVLSIL